MRSIRLLKYNRMQQLERSEITILQSTGKKATVPFFSDRSHGLFLIKPIKLLCDLIAQDQKLSSALPRKIAALAQKSHPKP